MTDVMEQDVSESEVTTEAGPQSHNVCAVCGASFHGAKHYHSRRARDRFGAENVCCPCATAGGYDCLVDDTTIKGGFTIMASAATKNRIQKTIKENAEIASRISRKNSAKKATAKTAKTAKTTTPKPKSDRAPRERRAPSAEGLDLEKLKKGTKLTAGYAGKTFSAEVVADGVKFRGSVYKSLSGAAYAAVQSAGGNKANGRRFWRIAS